MACHSAEPDRSQNLNAAYGDIKEIIGKEDATAQGKATEILHYVQVT